MTKLKRKVKDLHSDCSEHANGPTGIDGHQVR